MDYYIAFFLPSILGVKLFSYFNNEKNVFELIMNYLVFVLFSNLGSMLTMILIKSTATNIIDAIRYNFVFGFKYILLSIVFNIILTILLTAIKKYISVSIEVTKNEKNNNKKKKNI